MPRVPTDLATYVAELHYVETAWKNEPATFSNDRACFESYVRMNANAARADGFDLIARSLENVLRVHPVIAEFTTIESARDYRTQNGGWIFEAESGECIWFDAACYTPTLIFNHRVTRGLSGTLICR